jgi:ATP-binding cassette subfamily F protein uup
MLKPADVLLLDEPTNDLDIPTLEILEESLESFPGALVLVTHDRYLMDRVANVVLGLHPNGEANFYADAAQWERADKELRQARRAAEKSTKSQANSGEETRRRGGKKLSYKDQREWDTIEDRIHEAEAQAEEIEMQLADPAVVSDGDRARELLAKQKQARDAVDALYERWTELEAKQSG